MCSKSSWPTKWRADLVLFKIRQWPATEKLPVRSYHCPRCGRYHLTSQPLEFASKVTLDTRHKV